MQLRAELAGQVRLIDLVRQNLNHCHTVGEVPLHVRHACVSHHSDSSSKGIAPLRWLKLAAIVHRRQGEQYG
jgi:hypothetical protein